MKLRRHGIGLLAMLLVFALVAAACGNDDDDTATEAEPEATEAEPEATEAEPTEEAEATEPAEATEEAAASADGEPIVIGFPTASTEFLSFYDGPILESARLAAEDINAAGGVLGRPIEIVHADNQSDIALVESRAIELLDEGVDIIHTSCDFDFGSPAARAATERGVFALGCASAPEYGFEGLGELVFNTFPADITESSVMAQFTIDQGWDEVVLFEDQTLEATITVCETFEQVYTELGGTVLAVETFEGADVSLAPQLAALRDTTADAVVLCSVPPGGAAAVKQIRDESDLPIVSQVALEGEFWLDCCPGLSDFYAVGIASTAGDDPNPGRAAWVDDFTARTGEAPAVSIAMAGYAAVEALAIAIEMAGSTDGQAIAEAMAQFDAVDLVTGPTTYSPTCHVPLGRSMVMVEVQNGELAFNSEVTPSVLPDSIC